MNARRKALLAYLAALVTAPVAGMFALLGLVASGETLQWELDMRQALPNAKFIGLTGTPISTADRNTWETFGEPTDPGGVLNHYSVERSIADGATLPIHVETRSEDFAIDAEALTRPSPSSLPSKVSMSGRWESWLAGRPGSTRL